MSISGASQSSACDAEAAAWDRFVRVTAIAALVCLSCLVLYGALTAPLAEPDEARYAEVGREMVSSGDWLVPQVNDEAFLDKPPLVFWAEAAFLEHLGVRDWAARLPVVLSAGLCLLVVFALGVEWFGAPTAWLAVLLLATAPLFFGMSQVLTLDLPLTLWTTAAMAAVWYGHSRASPNWFRAAYVLTALGVLTKGPIAVVLVWLPAALFLIDRGERGDWRRVFDPLGIAAFLIVSVPWFVAVEARQPGFLLHFIVHHHFERFVNPWQHREPFWFFVPVFFAGFFPWSVLWILDRRGAADACERAWRSPQGAFAVLYAAVPFAVFSLSSSKLIPYVLPAFPPCALLLAAVYAPLLRERGRRLASRSGALLAVVGVALLVAGTSLFFFTPHWRAPLVRPFLMAGGLAFSLLGGSALYAGERGHPRVAFALVAAATIALTGLVQSGRSLAKSYRALAAGGRAYLAPDTRLFSYKHELPGVEFYLHRPVTVIESGDENELAHQWQGSGALAIFARSKQMDDLAGLLPDATVVAEGFDTVMIVRPPALAVAPAVPAVTVRD